MLTTEVARRIAARVFDTRSRPGRRNVEVHLSEEELVALLLNAIDLSRKLHATEEKMEVES